MSIGRIAPLILVCWVVLDLLVAVLGSSSLNIAPALIAMRFSGRFAPFQPGIQRYAGPQEGEAATVGNLRPTEWRSAGYFTTNRFGFRNNPRVDETIAPDIVIWGGDSFTYGAGLADDETLAARLTAHSGLTAFNAGRFFLDPEGLPELDWLLRQFQQKPRTLVYVHLEHHYAPAGSVPETEFVGWLKYGRKMAITWQQTSPFSIWSKRIFKQLSDDRVLPNEYKRAVARRLLPDGRPMLFRDYELEPASRSRTGAEASREADAFSRLRRQLILRGLDLHVLLLPSRYTVYGPWLETGARREAVVRAGEYLHALKGELDARGVGSTDALAIFQQQSEEELKTGRLFFYREDNHWNGRGVDLIARALASQLPH